MNTKYYEHCSYYLDDTSGSGLDPPPSQPPPSQLPPQVPRGS